MSFFYLTPVKGQMPLDLLESVLNKRLDYLIAINKGDCAIYNEFVIDGSIYDNVGHFMLCVAAILSENTSFIRFILKCELELFKQRFNSLSAYEVRIFAKKLLRTIKKYDSFPTFVEPLLVLSQHLVVKNLAQHVCLTTHSTQCYLHSIQLKFTHCLQFVAKRQIEIANGIATLPCGRWKQFIEILFYNHLLHKISKTAVEPLRNDFRIMEIIDRLKRQRSINLGPPKNLKSLLSKNVDKASKNFPPCMLNLHKNLRTKHRLTHDQRFNYSLFLKDIGMSVEEAIEFWRTEYRLNPHGSHSCIHNWEKDEKKYLYGIRHMYGLEGAKKSYSSVSCQRIQSCMSANSEGGCPFKNCDHSKMLALLDDRFVNSQILMSQLNELKAKKQYSSACTLYLRNNFQIPKEHWNISNFSFNLTPVQFYTKASI